MPVNEPRLFMAAISAALCLAGPIDASAYEGAADCEAYARNAAADEGRVLGGAARGAAKGAVLGGIFGDSSRKARRGAKIGAIGGGLRRAAEKDRARERAFDECMRAMRARQDKAAEEKSDD